MPLSVRLARHLTIALILSLSAAAVSADQPPRLGESVTAAELSRLSITVLPDGRGLPAGAGTALEGAAVYQAQCLACHGAAGQGGINAPLSGGIGTLVSTKPVRTVGSYWPYATSLFDYVRRSMPYNAPGSLSASELYAVTAYLLQINRIIPDTLALNATTLPAVVMPNRDGFNWPDTEYTKRDNTK